jgi:hypothetical protein
MRAPVAFFSFRRRPDPPPPHEQTDDAGERGQRRPEHGYARDGGANGVEGQERELTEQPADLTGLGGA